MGSKRSERGDKEADDRDRREPGRAVTRVFHHFLSTHYGPSGSLVTHYGLVSRSRT